MRPTKTTSGASSGRRRGGGGHLTAHERARTNWREKRRHQRRWCRRVRVLSHFSRESRRALWSVRVNQGPRAFHVTSRSACRYGGVHGHAMGSSPPVGWSGSQRRATVHSWTRGVGHPGPFPATESFPTTPEPLFATHYPSYVASRQLRGTEIAVKRTGEPPKFGCSAATR